MEAAFYERRSLTLTSRFMSLYEPERQVVGCDIFHRYEVIWAKSQ
jgi:hypothetical protein